MTELLTYPSSGLKTRDRNGGPSLDFLESRGSFDLHFRWSPEDLMALASVHVISYVHYFRLPDESVRSLSDTTSDLDSVAVAPALAGPHGQVQLPVTRTIATPSTLEGRKAALLTDLADVSRSRGLSLPAPVESTDEDGAAVVEYLLPHGILGFTVEQEEGRSGWYVVTDAAHGSVHACGLLASTSLQAILELAKPAGSR